MKEVFTTNAISSFRNILRFVEEAKTGREGDRQTDIERDTDRQTDIEVFTTNTIYFF